MRGSRRGNPSHCPVLRTVHRYDRGTPGSPARNGQGLALHDSPSGRWDRLRLASEPKTPTISSLADPLQKIVSKRSGNFNNLSDHLRALYEIAS